MEVEYAVVSGRLYHGVPTTNTCIAFTFKSNIININTGGTKLLDLETYRLGGSTLNESVTNVVLVSAISAPNW
jgi:hypothetical protein